ncbi:MAG TPA: hypothetical protein VF407_18600, partial [Polyangiaceae bacterium]
MNLFRLSAASLLSLSLALAACSGGDDSSNPGGGTPDGGPTGDGGGGTTDGGGPSGASCSSSATPTIIADPFNGVSPSLEGSDVYYIDPTQGTDLGGIKTGLLHHVKTDGTGDETILTPARPISAATVQGDSIFYFQSEPDDGTGNSPTHLYKMPRTGGAGTQVSTYDFMGLTDETQIDLPTTEYRIGVFAVQGTDAFLNEMNAISRVSLTDGTRTVIAGDASTRVFYPALMGSNIVYTSLDSASAANALYTVPISATSPSGTRVGTQTCGSTTSAWAASWTGGWMCGRLYGLDAIDATGANKTSFLDTKPTDTFVNPSAIDGTTFYGFGNGIGGGDTVRPLL